MTSRKSVSNKAVGVTTPNVPGNLLLPNENILVVGDAGSVYKSFRGRKMTG